MRFVLAIAAFFVAAVMIAFGIAQRTVLLEPSSIALEVSTAGRRFLRRHRRERAARASGRPDRDRSQDPDRSSWPSAVKPT